MTKNRLEAFSDGVIAILITILVLELAAIWFIPDRRIEKRLAEHEPH